MEGNVKSASGLSLICINTCITLLSCSPRKKPQTNKNQTKTKKPQTKTHHTLQTTFYCLHRLHFEVVSTLKKIYKIINEIQQTNKKGVFFFYVLFYFISQQEESLGACNSAICLLSQKRTKHI